MTLLRRLLEWIACRVGVHHASRWMHRRQLLICCYHGLRDDTSASSHWLLLPRRELVRQLQYLARHYRCMPLDEAIDALRTGQLREPTACITFDDGYASNRTVALPILQSMRLPATVYLTTGMVDTDRRLWTTALELAVMQSRAAVLDLSALGRGTISLGTGDHRRRIGMSIVESLKLRPLSEREAILAQLHAALGDAGPGDEGAFAIMGWDDARSMLQTGLIAFGAHTVNHDILSRVDDARVVSEVAGSMRTVEQMLGRTTKTFAFPNGRDVDFDARAVAAVRACGGIAAMSTREGLNASGDDSFVLRRIVVGSGMTLDDFRLQTSGAVSLLKRMLGRSDRDANSARVSNAAPTSPLSDSLGTVAS